MQNKPKSLKKTIIILFNRILRHLYKIWLRIFRAVYWLIAPNKMFNLGLRHCILFCLMFATPTMYRSTIQPCFKWIRYHIFLRIVMGKEWVTKYTQIKQQSKAKGLTYKQYAESVSQLDEMDGLCAWRINKQSNLYSFNRLHQDIVQLKSIREKCEQYARAIKSTPYQIGSTPSLYGAEYTHPLRELMEFLRSRIERNYCGITNPKLYSVTKIGTKHLIEDYIDQICQALMYIAHSDQDPSISVAEKIVFLNEVRHVLGRTALCLSGGGSLGTYHVGVVLAMHRNNLLPKIITGSSVGSVVASLVCTKLDDEIEDLTKEGILNVNYFDKTANRRWITGMYVRLRRFWQTGYFLDITVLRDCIRDNIGDITFLEAYQKTGRILNITVSGSDANTMPRILNFLTAPNVVIWSAVIASCAIPFVFEPQELFTKNPLSGKIDPVYLQGVTFSDGSVSHDLPMNKLQQLFNVDNFIVSQVNPHLVPFLFRSIVAPIPLFERLFRFLAHEFHLYTTTILVNLREFGILRGLGFINSLFTQKYTGDVTIVPDVMIKDYLGILSNPSYRYILRCAAISEQSTWKHISRLQGLCAVEFTIDEGLTHLRSQLVMERSESFKKMNRVSSFMAPTKETKGRREEEQKKEYVQDPQEDYNTLHIPQTIYNSILSHSQELSEVMDNVMDEDDEQPHDKTSNGKMAKTASDPRLIATAMGANDSQSSLHKSMSVAELCSDLNNIM